MTAGTRRPLSGESAPIADIDPMQPNVRFGEKQTSAQNSVGFLLTKFLTILALTDKAHTNGSVASLAGLGGSIYTQVPRPPVIGL